MYGVVATEISLGELFLWILNLLVLVLCGEVECHLATLYFADEFSEQFVPTEKSAHCAMA